MIIISWELPLIQNQTCQVNTNSNNNHEVYIDQMHQVSQMGTYKHAHNSVKYIFNLSQWVQALNSWCVGTQFGGP